MAPGMNRWIRIPIPWGTATELPSFAYATLHEDAGIVGSWQFPGPDAPVTVGSGPLQVRFRIWEGQEGDTDHFTLY